MARKLSGGGEVIDTVVQVAIDQYNRLIDAERTLTSRREALEKTMATLTPEQVATYIRYTP